MCNLATICIYSKAVVGIPSYQDQEALFFRVELRCGFPICLYAAGPLSLPVWSPNPNALL